MALLQNGTIQAQNRYRLMGGVLSDTRSMWNRTESRNWFVGENTEDPKYGIAAGTLAPGTWMLPQQTGGMATFTSIKGSGSVSAGTLAAGMNAVAALTGSGVLSNAELALVVSAVAALVGSGTVSNAAMSGKLEAVAALAGSGNVTAAIGALAGLMAGLTGTGTLAGAQAALGDMGANIRGYGELTPEGIRDTVWGAIMEAGFSAQDILVLLSAYAAGDATGLDGNPSFTGLDGVTQRLAATIAAGTRTITTRDPG